MSPDSESIGATEDAATGGETPPGACRDLRTSALARPGRPEHGDRGLLGGTEELFGLQLVRLDPFYAGAERAEERVRRIEEVDGILPAGESNVPAVARRICGEPPTTSTAL